MTTLNFAKAIQNKSVEVKQNALDKLNQALASGIAPDGSIMSPAQRDAITQLVGWLGVNQIVGSELCSAETLTQY